MTEFFSFEFWQMALAWCSLLILVFRAILSITSYDEPPPNLTIQRHAHLSRSQTGYVAAFMARNGILVTLSVFAMTGISTVEAMNPAGWLGAMAIALAFCFMVYHAGLVLLVSGKIIELCNTHEN